MNALVWLLRSLIEPVFWSTLQWIWSLDAAINGETWDLYLYGCPSTSVHLWMYEKCSPLLTLLVFIVGLCTTLRLFTSILYLLVKACCKGLLFLYLEVVRRVVVTVIRASTSVMSGCLKGIGILFSRFVTKTGQRETFQTTLLSRDCAPLCNGSEEVSFHSRKDMRLRTIPIDSSAFRPRRTKSSRGRRQEQ